MASNDFSGSSVVGRAFTSSHDCARSKSATAQLQSSPSRRPINSKQSLPALHSKKKEADNMRRLFNPPASSTSPVRRAARRNKCQEFSKSLTRGQTASLVSRTENARQSDSDIIVRNKMPDISELHAAAVARAVQSIQKQRLIKQKSEDEIMREKKRRQDKILAKNAERRRYRAEIYAINSFLQQLEQERFEAMIAGGDIEGMKYNSDDSVTTVDSESSGLCNDDNSDRGGSTVKQKQSNRRPNTTKHSFGV